MIVELPEGFRKGTRPKVTTVKELIQELQQLPGTMKVLGDFHERIRVVVAKVNNRYLAAMFSSDD